MSRIALHDLSPAFQAQAVAQLHGTPKPRTLRIEPAPFVELRQAAGKKRIRQNSAGLNKTEAAFLEYLKARFSGESDLVFAQAITLRIGNGVRFTPDFIVRLPDMPNLLAYETKGFLREDAAVKIKVAAALYPWIKFSLATKRKGGGWDIEEVLP